MPLNLMYITNKPEIACIAEQNGVQRIMVDMEIRGKEERQAGMNTVKSHHTVKDVAVMARVLKQAKVLARINPWYEGSATEIEAVIAAGADYIMLPMWKTPTEVDAFLQTVNKRVGTVLLLETKEAVACVDLVLAHPLLDEIYIGLNDLHLSYGLTFMFEPFVNGTVETIAYKCREKGIPFGVGGIARIGEGMVPAEKIIMEHYRIGSTGAIVSRSFCNAELIGDLAEAERIFAVELARVRKFEATLVGKTPEEYTQNRQAVAAGVQRVVDTILEKRAKV